MQKDQTIAIMLIAIIATIAVLTPTLTSGFGQMWSNLGDWLKYGWQDQEGTESAEGETGMKDGSYATMAITIHYIDGSSKVVKPKGLSILPLRIYDTSPVAVSYINVQMLAYVELVGTVTSWSSSGRALVKIYEFNTLIEFAILKDIALTPSGASWLNKEEKVLWDRDITAEELETAISEAGFGSGDYLMKFQHSMDSLTMTFSDSSTDTINVIGSYVSDWQFEYVATGISSVSLSVASQPFS